MSGVTSSMSHMVWCLGPWPLGPASNDNSETPHRHSVPPSFVGCPSCPSLQSSNFVSLIFEIDVQSFQTKKFLLTPTWFEHATFWSGVRRATVAPRSHSWEKSHRNTIHPKFWSVMANYSLVSRIDYRNTDTVFAISTCVFWQQARSNAFLIWGISLYNGEFTVVSRYVS